LPSFANVFPGTSYKPSQVSDVAVGRILNLDNISAILLLGTPKRINREIVHPIAFQPLS
jgi:hypothetical protein